MSNLDFKQISIINSIVSTNKINSSYDITNEHFFKKLVSELDPNIELIGGEIELIKDSKIGVRYSNFSSIIDCLKAYFNSKGIKEKLDQNFRINILFDETKIINKDNAQIETMLDIILLISYIGSINNKYSHAIPQDITNEIIDYIDKFLSFQSDFSVEDNYFPLTKKQSTILMERSEYKKEKDTLLELTINQDAEIRRLNDQLNILTLEFKKVKVKNEEYELRNNVTNKQSINEIQDLWLKSKLENSSLTREIEDFKLENINLTNTIKFNERIHQEDIEKYQNKIEVFEDRLAEFNNLKKQNEKLNTKLKDLQFIQNKQETINNNFDNEKLNNLLAENKKQAENITILKKELKMEKEKIKQLENSKRKETSNIFYESNKKMSLVFNNELKDGKDNDINHGDDSFILDIIPSQSSNLLKFNEINHNIINSEDKIEYLKINKQQIDGIHKLSDDKELLIKQIDSLENKLEKAIEEKENIEILNERLHIQISKLELDKQKVDLEMEKIKLFDNSNNLQEIISDKKTEINELYEKITKQKQENKALNDLVSKLEKEAQLKVLLNKKATTNNEISPRKDKKDLEIIQGKEKEIDSLKKEVLSLKGNNLEIEKAIKKLEDKNKELITKMKTMCSKEDLENYKKKYEELNSNVQKEHEVVSNNLYDLSVLFMGLKSEFQKRVESNKKK